MIDYIYTYFMLFTLYVSLAIEASGLLQVQIFLAKLSGEAIESQEPPRTATHNLFFWH